MKTESASPRSLLWQVPFSAAVWSGAYTYMIGAGVATVAGSPFRSAANQSRWAASAMKHVLRFTGSRFSVIYDSNFDPDRNSVFCQNHVSVMDGHVACRSIPQPFVGLMLAWHFKIPGYGWVMKSTHGIPVHPKNEGRSEKLTLEVKDRAAHGLSVLTYPEGHRTRDGRVAEFKRGAFFMARSANLPIVPIAVRGLYEVNRRRSLLFRPGNVTIYVGPQVETQGLSDEEISKLAQDTRSAVARFVESPESDANELQALAHRTHLRGPVATI